MLFAGAGARRLAGRPAALGGLDAHQVAALCLCALNPLTLHALEFGHPEELLGAVLCVWAVLLAQRGRAVSAGIVLGLAIANKEWALVASAPRCSPFPRAAC